jgi:hypothetical protein
MRLHSTPERPQEWRARTAFSNASRLEKLYKTPILSRNPKRLDEETLVSAEVPEVTGKLDDVNSPDQ